MKNIENIDELRKIDKIGFVNIEGSLEVATGFFPSRLITYKEINSGIEVREYFLENNKIDYEILDSIKENTFEYFKIKDLMDLHSQ